MINGNLALDGFDIRSIIPFLENLDIQILITNPYTDEIIYANRRMNSNYNVEDVDYIGKKCWQVYPKGRHSHCEFCNVERLLDKPETVLEWESYDKNCGKWTKNRENLFKTNNGTLLKLQQGVDITENKIQQSALVETVNQQELLNKISLKFLTSHGFADFAEAALNDIGNYLNVDKICLAKYEREKQRLKFMTTWTQKGQKPFILDEVPFYEGMQMYRYLMEEKRLYGEFDCKESEQLRKKLERYDAAYSVYFPIFIERELWGTINFVCVDRAIDWTEQDILFIRTLNNFMGASIKRKLMEEELIVMSSIADYSPYYITVIDSEGNMEYVNRGAMELTGYTKDEFKERGTWVLFQNESESNNRSHVSSKISIIDREGYWEGILDFKLKNGELHPFSCSGFKTLDGRIAVIAFDVNNVVEMSKNLVKAKNTAELASKAKGEFLSRMSHEIRTPLNAIVGMTNIALRNTDTKNRNYCLGKISDASRHLLGIINDILDMSKIEAGKFTPSIEEFLLEEMLENVIGIVNHRINLKKQNFAIKIGREVPAKIFSDRQRLAQVITNLLSNASKFTDEGGKIELRINLQEDDGKDCVIRVDVSDNGVGIPEERQDKLFNSFEQADNSISSKYGGTGLGLAISKNIVEMLNGRIWLESQPGKGSKFSFTFKTEPVREDYYKLDDNIDKDNIKVIVIGNNSGNIDYICGIAGGLGIGCKRFLSVETAVKYIKAVKGKFIAFLYSEFIPCALSEFEKLKIEGKDIIPVMVLDETEWANMVMENREPDMNVTITRPILPTKVLKTIRHCLTVPEVKPQEAGVEPKVEEQTPQNEKGAIFAGKKILLAEDVEINAEIVMAILDNTGVSIEWAKNGKEAKERFEKEPERYNLILMDVQMPIMNGVEATAKIRNLNCAYAAEIPILAMTANVFKEDIDSYLEAGMNDHIGKPVNGDEIVGKLKKYMK